MKDKKLIVLYVLMLIVGIALLFTKSTSEEKTSQNIPVQVTVKQEPKNEMEQITIAVAKRDIPQRTILTTDDYFFKTIEINPNSADKAKYITNAKQIHAYVTRNNIVSGTLLEHDFIASPSSQDFILLSLKPGNFMYPFKLSQADSYLIKNLHSGDLVDLYVFYGEETVAGRNNKENKYVSPSRDFISNRMKPIIVGKRVLLLESNTDKSTDYNIGKIQLELTNQEIKLVSTLMTNAQIFMYPSVFSGNVQDGLQLLSDKEKDWPLSNKDIFSPTQINRLRGN